MKKLFSNIIVDILLVVLVIGGIGFYLFNQNEKRHKVDEAPLTVNAPTAPPAPSEPKIDVPAPAPAAPVVKAAPKPVHKEVAHPVKKQHKEVHHAAAAKPVHKEGAKTASDEDLAIMRDMVKGN